MLLQIPRAGLFMLFLALIVLALTALGVEPAAGVLVSKYSPVDFALTASPDSEWWRNVPGVVADTDRMGAPLPHLRTEIRSRWTNSNLYFLFICRYPTLHLKPDPSTAAETSGLWMWDVAEAFIGSDFSNINRYREFEVSPQGEWVDLDIDLDRRAPVDGWPWNSGMKVKARIDSVAKVWIGEMCIPFDKVDTRPPGIGLELRLNLFRIQGPFLRPGGRTSRIYVAWQPTGTNSSHVPQSFGRLRLAE